jgi:tetratricopeptide (TPR) repeat protein
MKYQNRIYAIALMCWCCALQAAGGGGGGGAGGGGGGDTVSADPIIQSAQAAIAQKNWATAQATLLKGLSSDSQNADYHNLYAYSLRKSTNPDMGSVFNHYDEALRLNPKHRGAHEYMGEAYLMTNNLPKAKEHLAALDKLCFFGCEEYSDLKKAIASYEISHPH